MGHISTLQNLWSYSKIDCLFRELFYIFSKDEYIESRTTVEGMPKMTKASFWITIMYYHNDFSFLFSFQLSSNSIGHSFDN
jgi:hypothetical protein